jgi:hypothetical protein
VKELNDNDMVSLTPRGYLYCLLAFDGEYVNEAAYDDITCLAELMMEDRIVRLSVLNNWIEKHNGELPNEDWIELAREFVPKECIEEAPDA